MSRLDELGEEEMIARVLGILPASVANSRGLLVGVGDDCAVRQKGEELVLLKTDAVVEGVHFWPEEQARRVGRKAVGRVFSDFAAMGGWPEDVLVTLALPKNTEMAWLEALYLGMSDHLEAFGACLVGGETSAVPEGSAKVISVAGVGKVKKEELVCRSGGRVGDVLFVTGRLGGSLAGKHLDFIPRLVEARWLVQHFLPSAMMDLSDGLARDLPRLSRMSACGFELDLEALPRSPGCSTEQALGDGEDYELLFTIGPEQADELEKRWAEVFAELELTRIGRLAEWGVGQLPGGWQHFG